MTNVMHLGTKEAFYFDDINQQKFYDENLGNLESVNQYTHSKFSIDATLNHHPRYGNLARSIRERRGEKVEIKVPLFQDKNTVMNRSNSFEPFPGQIYMDSRSFGMGQCCLQMTYECSSMNHALYLHDQLVPFSSILAALSAAAPLHKGQVSDYDVRWKIIEQSCDDRTPEERDPSSDAYIPKSRYGTTYNYVSDHEFV